VVYEHNRTQTFGPTNMAFFTLVILKRSRVNICMMRFGDTNMFVKGQIHPYNGHFEKKELTGND
jgi:proline dehydrogenase